MTLDDSAGLVDRLDVRYNTSDSYDDESYDDPATEYDDESYDEPGEFINPFQLISQGINTAGRIIGGGLSGAARGVGVNLQGVQPRPANTSGIPGLSNLLGQLTNQAGRNFQFKLPQNVATKEDIATLKRGIDLHNAELKKVSEAITKNAQETAKIAGEVNRVDAKHVKATGEQNKVLRTMGTQLSKMNKRTSQLRRELQDSKQQAMMFGLLPMIMGGQNEPRQIDTIQIEKEGIEDGKTVFTVDETTFKESTSSSNNSMMPLMLMMMMGGMGGSSGSGGGMDGMMPLMLIMMMSGNANKK